MQDERASTALSSALASKLRREATPPALAGVSAAPAERDLLGEWFAALDAYGECYRFRLGRYLSGMSEPEWFFLSHALYDGLGGLAHVQRTLFRRSMVLPRATERAPGRLARLIAAARCLLRRGQHPLPWRHADPHWRPLDSASSTPSAVAWTLLSEHETLELRDQARRRGISLNAWLLWGLSRSTLPWLVPVRGNLEWIVPLNMRGAVACERDTANMAWTLDVVFPAQAEPEQIHRALGRERAQRAHWGAWQLMRLLRHFEPRVLRAVALRELRIRKHGSFSNLGRLEPPPATNAEREWWLAFNPVLSSRPVGAASLSWGDRLALTLQLHPALSRDPEQARAWLNDWARIALERSAYDAARCLAAPAHPNNALAMLDGGSTTDSPAPGGRNGA